MLVALGLVGRGQPRGEGVEGRAIVGLRGVGRCGRRPGLRFDPRDLGPALGQHLAESLLLTHVLVHLSQNARRGRGVGHPQHGVYRRADPAAGLLLLLHSGVPGVEFALLAGDDLVEAGNPGSPDFDRLQADIARREARPCAGETVRGVGGRFLRQRTAERRRQHAGPQTRPNRLPDPAAPDRHGRLRRIRLKDTPAQPRRIDPGQRRARRRPHGRRAG